MVYGKLIFMMLIWIVVTVAFCRHYINKYKKLSEKICRELKRLNDQHRELIQEAERLYADRIAEHERMITLFKPVIERIINPRSTPY